MTAVMSQQNPNPPLNNIQDLIKRKRDSDNNNRRQHLTEADCNLLLANANEYSFTSGQVIGREGEQLPSAYRVKSGSIDLMKDGNKFCELKQGYFMGEQIFLSQEQVTLHTDLVANGPVVLAEMNTKYVQNLFDTDRTLALKFYRYIASKHAVIYHTIVEELVFPTTNTTTLDFTVATTTLSSSEDSSTSSSDSSNPSSTTISPTRSPSTESINELGTPRRKLTKRQSFVLSRAPLKSYPLESSRAETRTVAIRSKKIEIRSEALGLRFRKKVPFNKILNFVQTSEISITIVCNNNKAKTLFFKQAGDLEEFYSVLTSIIERTSILASKYEPTSPISINNNKKNKDNGKDDIITNNEINFEGDKELLSRLGIRKTYKKGDIIVEEGDLFQRVFMINNGSISSMLKGHDINPLGTGDIFGILTMFHLRPFPTSIVVTSETAEITIIPAYKIHELININNDLAARVYQRSANILFHQIEKLVLENTEKGYLNY